MPSNSTICPRNGPKRRQKAPKTAQCAPAPRNQERAVSWATWLKNEFRGHLHPQPPTLCGFPNASGLTLPITEPRWCPCQIQLLSQKLTGGGPGRWRQVGRCPPKSVLGQKQPFFAQNSPSKGSKQPNEGPHGETLQMRLDFLATKGPLVPSNCTICPRCSNKCFWAMLSPWWRVLGHGKSQNALKMGRFGTNNGSEMGQKRVFPKVILDDS